jgi:Ni/Co efflux regulator RcnB
MREAQAQAQNQGQQGRPDWANGRGQGDNNNRGFQGRVQAPQQPPQAPPAPRVQDQNRFGQNNGQQPNYRNDPRANQNMGNRNFGNNAPRPGGPGYNNNNIGPRNYGNNGSYARNTWASRNDWARYDRRPRTQVNIRIGSFFGGNYPSIASRYYGHSYIWYGSRSWTSWNRPWRIGYMLPPSMYCEPLPYDLYFDLPPPPIGYDYVMCDGDILIVGEDSGVVYDAILPY